MRRGLAHLFGIQFESISCFQIIQRNRFCSSFGFFQKRFHWRLSAFLQGWYSQRFSRTILHWQSYQLFWIAWPKKWSMQQRNRTDPQCFFVTAILAQLIETRAQPALSRRSLIGHRNLYTSYMVPFFQEKLASKKFPKATEILGFYFNDLWMIKL